MLSVVFNDTATTEIYTLSLHDALPIFGIDLQDASGQVLDKNGCVRSPDCPVNSYGVVVNVNRTLPAEGSADTGTATIRWSADRKSTRLNSSHANISYAVFCLKKKIHQK